MNKPKCPKCDKPFSSAGALQKHMGKKRPCDKKSHKCDKCKKEFKYIRDFIRHQNRKTPCEPIAGNPLEKALPNACRFCYRKMSTKQALKTHYNTCKIKNGGMNILFDTIRKQQEQINLLLELNKNQIQNQIQNQQNAGRDINNDNSNHTNTKIDINFVNFNSEEHMKMAQDVLRVLAPKVLCAPIKQDEFAENQLQTRIMALVTGLYRNPECKELQGIYYGNKAAFAYDEGWQIKHKKDMNQELLQQIYNYVDKTKTVTKREDVMNVMKHLFILGGCGQSDIEKMTERQQIELYKEMGEKLAFKTLDIKFEDNT